MPKKKIDKKIKIDKAQQRDKPKYKMVDLKSLVAYAKNARTHSDEQVNQIASSIKEFGFLNPILIDGDLNIIAGHGRVLAAQKLGIKAVPVLEISHLTEAQKRAYVIADNKLALNAEWNEDLLRIELSELAENFDLQLIGFSAPELDVLLGDVKEKVDKKIEISSNYEYRVMLYCDDEHQQREYIEKMIEMGIKCEGLIL
jgi:ParB-like chromosome segregation protein Spo0J